MKASTRKRTLQSGLFKSYLLLAMAVLFVFSIFFYQYTSNILIDRETENMTSQLSYLQVQTDQSVKTLDDLSINIGYSNLIMSNLEEYFSENQPDLSQTKRLADLFVAINGTQVQADQINIYSFSGQTVGFGATSVSGYFDLRQQDWYMPTLELAGHKYISEPYITDSLSKNTRAQVYYISLYRTYYNRYGRQVGIIETMMRCNTAFKPLISLKNSDKNAPATYVFDQNNTLIYPYAEDDREKLSNPEQYLAVVESEAGHGTVRNSENKAQEVVAYERSRYTGWTYVSVIPEHVILTPVRRLMMLLGLIILSLLAIAAALSYTMAVRLSRPIKHLREIIHETELDTLGAKVKQPLEDGFEEVEELNQSFADMSDKLKLSMDQLLLAKNQEIKARVVALQSQINPHFYYNSLSSIIILAENQQCEEVVKLSRNLNAIMRYISRGSSTVVTIQEEISYLEKYLYCMKIRYQSSLSYELNISEDMAEEKIPKLIVQPLVENALKYGTDCYPPWKIEVNGRIINSPSGERGWLIEVTDHGPGFSEEVLQQFEQRKHEIDETEGLPDIDIDGMGLANVYARWMLHAGEEAYFYCDNLPDGGARVRIGRLTSDMEKML
ncbi:MAG: histidine kinase [Clostridiaceae bacterium]|nr:histidine kinase [Clostridiaceae bacterium]